MSRLTEWKAAVIVAALVAWPLVATAQSNQQTGTAGQQQPPATTQPPTGTQQPPAGTQAVGQAQPQGQTGSPQAQGTESQRQAALARLTAARQDLADLTKLPAASHIEGQARSDLNQLIQNFNSLISSTGPEWRQAFDHVQENLAALLGPDPQAQGGGQSAVGTTGALPSLDPTIVAKLSDMRQQINQFGEMVGVKPGQSAVAQQQGVLGGAAATSGTMPEVQALRTNIDQIAAIVARLLSQGTADQPTIAVSREDLQQIQQYLAQMRQSLGQTPIK